MIPADSPLESGAWLKLQRALGNRCLCCSSLFASLYFVSSDEKLVIWTEKRRNSVWYSFARLFICFAAKSVALEQRNMLAWILKVIKRWSIIKSKENFYRSLNSGHFRFSVDVSVIVIFEEVYTVLIFLKNFCTVYRSRNSTTCWR